MVAVTGAVNAVTGAVTVVTWGRDPALDVTGTVPAVIAVADCHSPSRRADRPGHACPATLGSLVHATLACATEVAIALPESIPTRVDARCIAVGRVAGHVPRATPRSPKCPKAETAPLPAKGCHAATGARIVPWQQPGDWLINLPIAPTALLRSEPDQDGGQRR